MWEIGASMGESEDETELVVQYLQGDYLVEFVHAGACQHSRDPLYNARGEAYNPLMSRVIAAGLVLVFSAALSAQEPVISRSAPMTLTGEIVDISCYKQKGVAAGTGAAHVDCAKICVLHEGRRRSAS